jgi:hypothetical protein
MDEEWNLPWTGGCRCGKLRFDVNAPPVMSWAGHCSGCRRMTASAYSLTLTVPAPGFRVSGGEPVIGGLHGPSRHHGCGHCLSWVFTRPHGMDDFVNLRATMLDEHGWFEPFVEVWTREKLPWAATPAKHSFATDPEDAEFELLLTDFAERGARPG